MSRARRHPRQPRRRPPTDRGAPAPVAGRDPDEVTLVVVTKFFPPPTSGSSPSSASPTSARTATRRPPTRRRVRRPRAALALHRWPAEQQGGGGRVVRRRGRVGRPGQAGRPAPARRPRPRHDPSTCCSRSASTRPTPGRPGGRRPRRTWPTSPRAVDEAGMPAAARADGRRAARGGPDAAFARLADIRAGFVADHPDATGCPPG